jgi:hypothetical protein
VSVAAETLTPAPGARTLDAITAEIRSAEEELAAMERRLKELFVAHPEDRPVVLNGRATLRAEFGRPINSEIVKLLQERARFATDRWPRLLSEFARLKSAAQKGA